MSRGTDSFPTREWRSSSSGSSGSIQNTSSETWPCTDTGWRGLMIAVRVPLSMAAVMRVERDIVRHLFHRSTRAGIVTIVGALFLLSAQRAPLPSAREIVQRPVAAIGGEAARKAVKSLRRRGKFEITGQNITAEFEELTARPDKLLLTAD